MPKMPPKWPDPAQKRRRGGSVKKNAVAEAPGHAIKLEVSTRANHEIGPRATGPVTRLDTAGRLYAENASKMA